MQPWFFHTNSEHLTVSSAPLDLKSANHVGAVDQRTLKPKIGFLYMCRISPRLYENYNEMKIHDLFQVFLQFFFKKHNILVLPPLYTEIYSET